MIFPEGISLKEWAAQLAVDFSTEVFPILENEADWKRWGDIIVTYDIFARSNAPTTDGFDDWRDWAKQIYSNL